MPREADLGWNIRVTCLAGWLAWLPGCGPERPRETQTGLEASKEGQSGPEMPICKGRAWKDEPVVRLAG